MNVYQGYASQYGHGLGNVLGGVARAALPIVKNIAKKAGAQLLDTGLDFIQKKVIRKRKAAKRSTSRPAKRTTSHSTKHKSRKPPGKPVRRSSRKRKPRDIFE